MIKTPKTPLVIISYARSDDEYTGYALKDFREALSHTLRFVSGKKEMAMAIFQEGIDVEIGQQVHERINQSLNDAMVLVPVLTPSFLTDQVCRDILARFLERERQLGRNDLVLPMYYQHASDLANAQESAQPDGDPLIQAIVQRRMLDWRELRRDNPFSDPQVRQKLEPLARRIIEILKELQTPPPPEKVPSPVEPVRPWQFLQAQGLLQIDEDTYERLFQANDRDYNDRYRELYAFIPMPIINRYSRVEFEELLEPRSFFLFGEIGHGKTRHRHEIARRIEYEGIRQKPALHVEITTLPQGPEQTTLLLLTKLTEQSTIAVEARRSKHNFSPRYTDCIELYALYRVFHPHEDIPSYLQSARNTIEEKAAQFSQEFKQQPGVGQFWKTFQSLLSNLEFGHVAVLIDLDDYKLTEEQIEALKSVVHHCYRDPTMVVKGFFKPEYRNPLDTPFSNISRYSLEADGSDPDIIERLKQMLEARLSRHALPPGESRQETAGIPVVFDQFCVDQNVSERLAQAAKGSPRQLFHLARTLIEEHCRSIMNPEESITTEIVDRILS